MKTKEFLIDRLEESKVLRKVRYQISANNKKTALKKLQRMKYDYREIRDEIQEDDWIPYEIISIV